MRGLIGEQMRLAAAETQTNIIERFRNRTFLRNHVVHLFEQEGGLSGFVAWGQDIAKALAPEDARAAPVVTETRRAAPRVEGTEDMNVQDEPDEPIPPEVYKRVREMNLRQGPPVGEVPAPPPPVPPALDFAQVNAVIDARFAQLPQIIAGIVQDALARRGPPPLTLPIPPPSGGNFRNPFGLSPGWPHNSR